MKKECPDKKEEGGVAESEARNVETLARVEKRKCREK